MSKLLKISVMAIAMMFIATTHAEAVDKERGEIRRVSRRTNRRMKRREDRKEDKKKDAAAPAANTPATNSPETPAGGAIPAGQ